MSPTADPSSSPACANAAPAPGTALSPEDARRLQSALRELTECRKLLDATFEATA